MATATIIGRDTRVHARVSGAGDIEVQGHLEGELTVGGEARIESTATVAADVRARRIVVRGAVKGDLSADESILLEDGARVVGDVRAPRVAIAPGGLVRGYVETQAAGAKPASRAVTPARRVDGVRAVPPAPKSKPAVVHVAAKHAAPKGRGITLAGGKAPPPVVPVLKKGTKAALTKRR
ncbi:MAG TPA: polymer-forming cytoskeletal protein [Polyangiaceae bacterium]|jgi:cytoskeletal protein CcmA (bactofilin family)